jgi:hypothetical protein
MSSHLKPGDIITLESFFYVYELIDDFGLVFYVGISRDPAYRFRSHANPKHCDRPIICETIAECANATMRIVSVHGNRREAESAEGERIRITPGVINEKGLQDPVAVKRKRNRARNARRQKARKLHILAGGSPAPSPAPSPPAP